MSPQDISAIAALATLFQKIGTWPLSGIIAAVVLGPSILISFVLLQNSRETQKWKEAFATTQRTWESRHEEEEKRWQQRHQDVVRMYENNVELLKTTQRLAQDSQDMVIFNTQSLDKMYNVAKNNTYCPIERGRKGPG